MWIWGIGGKLVNLSMAQIIEVTTNYVEGSDLDGDPDFYTVDAIFADDGFVLLFQDDEEARCEVALQLLAEYLATNNTTDGATQGKIWSLEELMTIAGEDSKN